LCCNTSLNFLNQLCLRKRKFYCSDSTTFSLIYAAIDNFEIKGFIVVKSILKGNINTKKNYFSFIKKNIYVLSFEASLTTIIS